MESCLANVLITIVVLHWNSLTIILSHIGVLLTDLMTTYLWHLAFLDLQRLSLVFGKTLLY